MKTSHRAQEARRERRHAGVSSFTDKQNTFFANLKGKSRQIHQQIEIVPNTCTSSLQRLPTHIKITVNNEIYE